MCMPTGIAETQFFDHLSQTHQQGSGWEMKPGDWKTFSEIECQRLRWQLQLLHWNARPGGLIS